MPRSKLPEAEHCENVSVSFTPDDLKRLKHYCETRDRTYAWVIRKALNKWLDEHEKTDPEV